MSSGMLKGILHFEFNFFLIYEIENHKSLQSNKVPSGGFMSTYSGNPTSPSCSPEGYEFDWDAFKQGKLYVLNGSNTENCVKWIFTLPFRPVFPTEFLKNTISCRDLQ